MVTTPLGQRVLRNTKVVFLLIAGFNTFLAIFELVAQQVNP
jgi:preprotein translocase subunit SecE